MPLTLMYITNNPAVALIAEKYGVDRIWIDLETLGKEERQKGMNTVKSNHTIRDIEVISKILTKAELLVRVNPWNEGSISEIEAVIAAGADRIMLPMWKSIEEVDMFLKTVNKRVHTTLLLETKEAVECLDAVLNNPLLEEIHIGLNDLHLSYGLTFMFELLTNGVVEQICEKCKSKNIPYGFGGIAKLGDGMLPAEKIVMEHYRLGSTRAILSRSFCDNAKVDSIDEIDKIFKINMSVLRNYEVQVETMNENSFIQNRNFVIRCVNDIVSHIKEKNNV